MIMKMVLPTTTSCGVASILCLITFALMQLFKTQLGSSKGMTLLGGFLGSQVFVFGLTAMNNFENLILGRNFQSKLFPEVIICLLVSMVASGMVHRVCVTTCFLFSIVALYYINKISTSRQSAISQAAVKSKGKKTN
uniref:Keratinocyte-associated protein 2 n=1 Tax=Hydra vulgaris TaxID=6087 RepID=T2MA13_HYDVU